jgi:CBS domain-containing protein
MKCRDVMLTLVFKCRPDTPASACAQMMRDDRIGFVPVVDDSGAVVGVVTDRDLTLRVLAGRRHPSTPVSRIMSPGPFVSCAPDDDLAQLERRLAIARKSRAVVLGADGKLVGIVSLSDIAQAEPSAARVGQLMREVTHRESAMIARP